MTKNERKLVRHLTEKIGAVLHGQGPAVQGVVLTDLVSMWLAGHPPEIRQESRALFIEMVDSLVPINEEMVMESYGGWPEGWRPN